MWKTHMVYISLIVVLIGVGVNRHFKMLEYKKCRDAAQELSNQFLDNWLKAVTLGQKTVPVPVIQPQLQASTLPSRRMAKLEALMRRSHEIEDISTSTSIQDWENDELTDKSDLNYNITSDDTDIINPNNYGSGVHRNRYGQPVELRPDYNYVPGEQLKIKTDAYGLGVHMDQYGRPVREYPLN